jgi:RNA polymerase sigma-B factor
VPALAARDRSRDRQIERHLPLVRALARRYATSGEPLDDLVQVGAIGLIKAVDRFDPTREIPFELYAGAAIAGEIRHHLRDRCAPVRVPRRTGARVRFDSLDAQPLLDTRSTGADPAAVTADRVALVEALRRLHPRTCRLLLLCFFGDLPQARAAAALGISPVHASRLLHDALAVLRCELADGGPGSPLGRPVASAAHRG